MSQMNLGLSHLWALGLCASVGMLGCGGGDDGPPDGSVLEAGTDGSAADGDVRDAMTQSDGGGTPPTDGGGAEGGFPDATPGGACGETARPDHYRVVGYFAGWTTYARGYFVKHVPARLLTHLNYAFVNISESGECEIGDAWADTDRTYSAADSVSGVADDWTDSMNHRAGNFGQLRQLKAAHPHLKVILSIGGWTWSGRFSDVALTPASRERFTRSCVRMMAEQGFDGLDIDWEYPVSGGLEANITRPADRANYTLLLAELRRQLDAQGTMDGGRHYELSIAAPAGAGTILNYEIDRIHEHLDFINLMAYDLHGPWSAFTNHNAPMRADPNDPNTDESIRDDFNVHTAVNTWLAGGTPADKLVLGVAFYGHGFRMVADTAMRCGESGTEACNGLFQTFGGAAMGTYPSPELGAFTGTTEWSQARADSPVEDMQYYLSMMGPGGWSRHWSDRGQVPWLWNATTGVMISYDDAESICIKRDYAVSRGLGGAMIWELSADDNENSLTEAVQ